MTKQKERLKTRSLHYGHPPYGKTKKEHRAYFAWWRNLDREDYNRKRLKWANDNRERRTRQSRASHIKMKFNISIEKQEEMLKKQENRCAICSTLFKKRTDKLGRVIPTFCIDHDHETGTVRGLLCKQCNLGLGNFNDSLDVLLKATEYIKKFLVDDKVMQVEDFL